MPPRPRRWAAPPPPMLAALLAAAAPRAAAEADGEVLVLTDSNFTRTIEDHDLMLVDFFWDGCVHCKTMIPRLEEAARIMAADDPPILVAKVDAEENRRALGVADVTSYPSMKISRRGVLEDWYADGSSLLDKTWEVDGMVEKMRAAKGPSSKVLTQSDELTRFTRKELKEVSVLGYFPKGEDHIDFKMFHRTAHRFLRKLPFYHVTAQPLLERAGHLGRQHAIMIYRPWGGKKFKLMYRGPLTKNGLFDWVSENRAPLIEWVDKAGFALRKERDLPILRAFVLPEKREEQAAALREALAPLCEEHSRRFACVITDAVPAQVPEEDERPSDWDEDEDGVWRPKYVSNPEFSDADMGLQSVDKYGFSAEDVELMKALVIEEAQRKKPASFVYDGSGVGGAVAEAAADWVARWRRKKAPKWHPPAQASDDDGFDFVRPASSAGDDEM